MSLSKSTLTKSIQNRGNYSLVPNEVCSLPLSLKAKVIYLYIISQNEDWHPGYRAIKEGTGIKNNQHIKRALKELQEARMLVIHESRHGERNLYELLEVDEWILATGTGNNSDPIQEKPKTKFQDPVAGEGNVSEVGVEGSSSCTADRTTDPDNSYPSEHPHHPTTKQHEHVRGSQNGTQNPSDPSGQYSSIPEPENVPHLTFEQLLVKWKVDYSKSLRTPELKHALRVLMKNLFDHGHHPAELTYSQKQAIMKAIGTEHKHPKQTQSTYDKWLRMVELDYENAVAAYLPELKESMESSKPKQTKPKVDPHLQRMREYAVEYLKRKMAKNAQVKYQ